ARFVLPIGAYGRLLYLGIAGRSDLLAPGVLLQDPEETVDGQLRLLLVEFDVDPGDVGEAAVLQQGVPAPVVGVLPDVGRIVDLDGADLSAVGDDEVDLPGSPSAASHDRRVGQDGERLLGRVARLEPSQQPEDPALAIGRYRKPSY